MRFKVVLALCATIIVLTASAQAGWWHRHHRCPHCSGYGGGTVGVASTGGEFSSASGEAYVVRTVPERVRYYAVSERADRQIPWIFARREAPKKRPKKRCARKSVASRPRRCVCAKPREKQWRNGLARAAGPVPKPRARRILRRSCRAFRWCLSCWTGCGVAAGGVGYSVAATTRPIAKPNWPIFGNRFVSYNETKEGGRPMRVRVTGPTGGAGHHSIPAVRIRQGAAAKTHTRMVQPRPSRNARSNFPLSVPSVSSNWKRSWKS